MSAGRLVLAFAGTLVLLSLALSQFFSPAWLSLAAFVGLNLVQASFTRFCPAAWVFRKFGARPGEAFP
jgi:hypothetical protein